VSTTLLGPLLDEAPCGFLRVADDGRIFAMNATLRRMLGDATEAAELGQIDRLLGPAARVFYQVSLFPSLRLSGALDEIYLTLQKNSGGEIPVLANVRRREEEACSDWVVVRIEQRGRWEEEMLQAKRTAERESHESARMSEELSRAKAALEATLADLKQSNWMLSKAAEVLPTCMYCNRVKGNQAQWETAFELLKRSSVFLSHGCCPECMPRMFADFGLKSDDIPSFRGDQY
jgi:sigma-B regulation protein RsbU (phosphoserine phosphatase)